MFNFEFLPSDLFCAVFFPIYNFTKETKVIRQNVSAQKLSVKVGNKSKKQTMSQSCKYRYVSETE